MLNNIHRPDPLCWTGTHDVNLLNPDPATLDLNDIARSLSRRPRYGGFSQDVVTVGQHSLLCLKLMEELRAEAPETVQENWDLCSLAVLMHDASEAYLSDIQRPLKQTPALSGYRYVEMIFEIAIEKRFGFFAARSLPGFPDFLKRIDNLALAVEVALCHPTAADRWSGLPEVNERHFKLLMPMLHTGSAYIATTFKLRAQLLMGRIAQ